MKLFKIKEFAGGVLAQMLNALAWAGVILMVSLYFQIVSGDSALQAGLSLLPLDATYIVFGPLSGRLSDRYGTRLFATLGLSITSIGFFLISTITASTQYWVMAAGLLLLGTGNGMFVSSNVSSVMSSVPANRRGIASGFRVTLFNVGLTASSGITVLLITLGIPYGLFTSLLENVDPHTIAQVAKDQFVDGFRLATLVLTIVNTIAIIPSYLGGAKLQRF